MKSAPIVCGTAALVSAALLAGAAAQSSPAAESGPCSVAHLQRLAPSGTTITRATVVAASDTLPRHCLVDGHAVSVGNTVNVRVGLPDG
jgi:hypothetical protein